jgi:hypothetical protein
MESNIDNSSDASKMSAHAKRRAQKKLKKQQGQNDSVNDQSNTPSEAGADTKQAESNAAKQQKLFKTKQVREPAGQVGSAAGA